MKARRLVVEHDVVGAGHAHDEIDACHAEQGQDRIHVVLVGLGVVGVANVDTHRQPEQLAAAMVLQRGTQDLLAVVKIFGADEADDRIDQQRPELPGDAIGAAFEGLLVDAVVGAGRQCRALAGFEIQRVAADGAAAKRSGGVLRCAEQRQVDAEAAVGTFGAGDRLEGKIDRRAALDQLQRRRDMGEHAALRRNIEALADVVEQRQQRRGRLQAVAGRVDADAGVTRAEQQAIEDRRGDACGIVGRVVGLQPGRQPAGQAERVAERRDDTDFARHRDQVLVAHQLRYRSDHFGGQAGRHGGDLDAIDRQQPFAELPDGHRRDRREGRCIMAVDDQPRDLVGLIRDDEIAEEHRQRQVGEAIACRHPRLGGRSGDPRQHIAGTQWRRRRQQPGEVGEAMPGAAEIDAICRHQASRSCSMAASKPGRRRSSCQNHNAPTAMYSANAQGIRS